MSAVITALAEAYQAEGYQQWLYDSTEVRTINEGRTATHRLPCPWSGQQVEAMMADLGLAPANWDRASRLAVVEQVDTLASLVLRMDATLRKAGYYVREIQSPQQVQRRNTRYLVMDPERVEWAWEMLSEARLLYGPVSPSRHYGGGRRYRWSEHDLMDLDAQCARSQEPVPVQTRRTA